MNLKRKLSLTVSILMVLLICSALVVYGNAQAAVIGAASANLTAPSYTVGSEFAGVIDKQFVSEGDTVKKGQKLFTVQSAQLLSQLNSGQLSSANFPERLTADGALIIVASHDGVVTHIGYLAGAFVPAGQTIATINGNSGLSIEASFVLSGPQYARLTPNSQLHVKLGGQDITARVTGVTQRSSNGKTYTIVTGKLPTVQKGQTLYSTGSSVRARIILTDQTFYKSLRTDIKKLT
jgi:multidrug efflux pump subunit AcrA (membrane-fusion protein)